MPPTTQEILDGLAAMQQAPIAPGYCGIAKSAAVKIQEMRTALSALLVEYVAARKEGHIDSFPATARKVVADATEAIGFEQ